MKLSILGLVAVSIGIVAALPADLAPRITTVEIREDKSYDIGGWKVTSRDVVTAKTGSNWAVPSPGNDRVWLVNTLAHSISNIQGGGAQIETVAGGWKWTGNTFVTGYVYSVIPYNLLYALIDDALAKTYTSDNNAVHFDVYQNDRAYVKIYTFDIFPADAY